MIKALKELFSKSEEHNHEHNEYLTNCFKDVRDKNIKSFIKYLIENGAYPIPVTNEWEVFRFKFNKKKYVIYRNKRHKYSFSNSELGFIYYNFLEE